MRFAQSNISVLQEYATVDFSIVLHIFIIGCDINLVRMEV